MKKRELHIKDKQAKQINNFACFEFLIQQNFKLYSANKRILALVLLVCNSWIWASIVLLSYKKIRINKFPPKKTPTEINSICCTPENLHFEAQVMKVWFFDDCSCTCRGDFQIFQAQNVWQLTIQKWVAKAGWNGIFLSFQPRLSSDPKKRSSKSAIVALVTLVRSCVFQRQFHIFFGLRGIAIASRSRNNDSLYTQIGQHVGECGTSETQFESVERDKGPD